MKFAGEPIRLMSLALVIASLAGPLHLPGAGQTPDARQDAQVGRCGESLMVWHPPVINGCDTGHEHGSPPPAWVRASAKPPMFHGNHGTSALENTTKHAFMKGYTLVDTVKPCLQAYVIQHGSSMGMERIARFHSTQFWIKDCGGTVSYGSFWTDFGDPRLYPTGHRVEPENFDAIHQELANQGIMRVNRDPQPRDEQWYGAVGGNKPDLSLFLGNSIESYTDAEQTNPDGEYDPANWQLTGGLGLFRQLEVVWPSGRIQVGRYQTDQFGNEVTSCAETSTYDGVSYPRQCQDWVIQKRFKDDVLSKAPEFGYKRAFFLYRDNKIKCGPTCQAPN